MSKGDFDPPTCERREIPIIHAPARILVPEPEVLPPRREDVPAQDVVRILVGTLGQDAEAKNEQLARLFDALGTSITQARAGYERELKSLQRQLDLSRADRESEQASFEARVSANLQDVRAERDHLRARVRELELARDGITHDLLSERRRGFFARLFNR